MRYNPLRYTFQRNHIYYIQFRFADGKSFKRSLNTDSYREASTMMASLIPLVPFVQDRTLAITDFTNRIDAIRASLNGNLKGILSFNSVKPEQVKPVDLKVAASGVTLAKAWQLYKHAKGGNWSHSIRLANERYIEVLMAVLSPNKDVSTITKVDIKKVMEVVENLPKRVVQPYRSMTINELMACDVSEENLVGEEAIFKHLKIFKSLFKTFLTDDISLIEKPPTDGITANKSKARYGAYTASEMKKIVSWALEQPEGWQRWVWLLLTYTGCRRSEIATLTKKQIKFDEGCQRRYLLIAENGQGKNENATRRIVVHRHLLEWGFLEYVAQCDDLLFPDVAGSNMAKIGKTFSDAREQIGIDYLDEHGQRRLVHSIRHTVASSANAGWVTNISHLQQILGHQMTGIGITKRYFHTFPIDTVCYVIDNLDWS
ncbi:tyrosine-type recombinase/integrase [Pantoea sp. T14]|uniref:tyrosine-type recombinase/integrase n=1 Tax=Pantoea sp. T14 TaxID=3085685 RepID=UPI002FC8A209